MWYYPTRLTSSSNGVVYIKNELTQGEIGCSAIVALIRPTVLADRKRLDVGMLLLVSKTLKRFLKQFV